MTGNGTPGGPKIAHRTLIGVPPPPPSRRPSLSGIVAPPPPVRKGPAANASPPAGGAAPENDLALSRTVLASAPEIPVPPELQAAVLVPTVPAPNAVVEPAPPYAAPPLPAPTEPVAAVVPAPYQAAPVDQTPAVATASFDVPAQKTPRRRFRAGTIAAVTAVALVSGFAMTLVIGRAVGGAPATVVASAKPRAIEPTSGPTAARPEAELPAKTAGTPAITPRETTAGKVAELVREPAEVPVSSVTAPSCREILGDAVVAKADPEAALAETQAGNRELVRGNMDASQKAFCKATLLDDAKVERWLNVAQLFLIRRDANKAVESAERALELDSKNARAFEILGDASARLGKLTEARQAYLAAEKRPEPDEDQKKWLVRRDWDEAQRSVKSRDFVRAERLFRRVVVFEPDHAGATRSVAACLRKLNDGAGAEAWARRADALERNYR